MNARSVRDWCELREARITAILHEGGWFVSISNGDASIGYIEIEDTQFDRALSWAMLAFDTRLFGGRS